MRRRTRAASLEYTGLKYNTGHNSSTMGFVNKAINVTIEYYTTTITASLDKTKPAPTIAYDNKVILQDVGILTNLQVFTGDGAIVEVMEETSKTITEAANLIQSKCSSNKTLVPQDALSYMN